MSAQDWMRIEAEDEWLRGDGWRLRCGSDWIAYLPETAHIQHKVCDAAREPEEAQAEWDRTWAPEFAPEDLTRAEIDEMIPRAQAMADEAGHRAEFARRQVVRLWQRRVALGGGDGAP